MDPICIPTLDHVFSSQNHTRDIPKRQLESLSELQYDGESYIFSLEHVDQFIHKCICFNITNDNAICRLFTLVIT